MKYREIVDAWKYRPLESVSDLIASMPLWVHGIMVHRADEYSPPTISRLLYDPTRRAVVGELEPGDWIVRRPDGSLMIVKDVDFRVGYEPVP